MVTNAQMAMAKRSPLALATTLQHVGTMGDVQKPSVFIDTTEQTQIETTVNLGDNSLDHK